MNLHQIHILYNDNFHRDVLHKVYTKNLWLSYFQIYYYYLYQKYPHPVDDPLRAVPPEYPDPTSLENKVDILNAINIYHLQNLHKKLSPMVLNFLTF